MSGCYIRAPIKENACLKWKAREFMTYVQYELEQDYLVITLHAMEKHK